MKFRFDARGVAAVEFALVLPIMLLLYLGATVVTDSVVTNSKVTNLAASLLDLTDRLNTSTQSTSYPTPQQATTQAQLSAMMTAAQSLLFPEPTSSLQMTITALDISAFYSHSNCCYAHVRWSFTQGGSLTPCGTQGGIGDYFNSRLFDSTAIAPNEVYPTKVYLLEVNVSYTYQPLMATTILPWSPKFQSTLYGIPRSVGQVITGPLGPSGNQNGHICY